MEVQYASSLDVAVHRFPVRLPRQLDQNQVIPLPPDLRLPHAELVDPVVEDLQGTAHGVFPLRSAQRSALGCLQLLQVRLYQDAHASAQIQPQLNPPVRPFLELHDLLAEVVLQVEQQLLPAEVTAEHLLHGPHPGHGPSLGPVIFPGLVDEKAVLLRERLLRFHALELPQSIGGLALRVELDLISRSVRQIALVIGNEKIPFDGGVEEGESNTH